MIHLKNKTTGTMIILLVIFLPFIFCHSTQIEPVQIKAADLKDWTIVAPDDAIPSERFAAREFQSLFALAAAMELPIVANPIAPTQNIFIGPGKAMAASNAGFSINDLGQEGLRLHIKPDNMAIAGGRPRGTLYGVYEFFERYFNVRYLTHDHTVMPDSVTTFNIPCEDYAYMPVFSFRWSYYRENVEHPEFAARLRINTATDTEELGGISSQRLINHSLHRQLPVARYGKDHPEYFALVNGDRKLEMWGGGPQPCVTNPAVIDIVTAAVLQEIEENPQVTNISVSQNDNNAYCQCDRCQAINQREGAPMGAHLAFINTIADRVAEKYAHIQVGTLAYWHTRKPPKTIRPHQNVQIQLANIESCVLHPITDSTCARNREFLADLSAWEKICKQIYIWTYATNFRYYDLPLPNLRAIGPNINYFARHNVKGVFVQANGGGTSGELSDLRNYVIARCLWNPTLDGWQQVQEFCKLHYGQAAAPILDYLNLVHDQVEAAGKHPTCFATPQQLALTPELVTQIYACFDRARSLAEDAMVRNRVEKIAIAAYRAMLESGYVIEFKDGKLKRKYPAGSGAVIETYIALCHKHKMTMADERTSLDDFEKKLRSDYASGIPAARLENNVWRLTVVPEDNGKIVEMFHKPSGRHLVSALQNNFIYGSLEEWGASGYDHESAPCKFNVTSLENTLVLTGYLSDGSRYERKIELPAGAPGTIRCLTRLIHGGVNPKVYQFIVHPEFNTGTFSDDSNVLSAYVNHNGNWVIYNNGLINDQGPGVHLLTAATGGGAHAFYNHESNYGILETYDTEKIERLRTWWVPDNAMLNLELLTRAVTLNRGAAFEFSYTFEYLDQPPRPGKPEIPNPKYQIPKKSQ